jgi:nicotinamidase-related amidase
MEEPFGFGQTFVAPIDFAQASPALLVVDMQYSGAAAGRGLCLALDRISPGCCDYYNARNEGMTVPGIAHLVDGFRERSLPIVYLCFGSEHRDLRDMPERQRAWVRSIEDQSGIRDLFWAQSAEYAVRAEFAPRQHDTVIQKTTWGAFTSSPLDLTLRSMKVDTLVVTGVSTSCCVGATARDAADRGYGCVLVDECTADLDSDAQQATLRSFYLRFGRVCRTTEEILAAIDQQATL